MLKSLGEAIVELYEPVYVIKSQTSPETVVSLLTKREDEDFQESTVSIHECDCISMSALRWKLSTIFTLLPPNS